MPLLRGWVYAPAQERPGTAGFVVITNDRWNQSMLQIGVLPVRTSIEPFDEPYSVPLTGDRAVIASRLGASDEGSDSPLLGSVVTALSPTELATVEDRLCEFLQIPALLAPAPRIPPPLGEAGRYPVWGQIYLAGPPVQGERKRRVVVSPNAWNALSGMATFVRTTTSFDRHGPEFPPIQGGAVRACCGDAATFEHRRVLLAPRDRPVPQAVTMQDIVAIARGLVVTHELEAAVARAATGGPAGP